MSKEISNEQKAHDLAIAYAAHLATVQDGKNENGFYQDYKDCYEHFLDLVQKS